MRRAILTFAGTVTCLVMLLGLKAQDTAPLVSPIVVADSGSAASSGSASVERTGDAVSTPYGPVQVKVTLAASTITSVSAVSYPSGDPHSQEISTYAIPQLTQEAIAADSADIDMVSGATYTSRGYIRSLQSALDQVR